MIAYNVENDIGEAIEGVLKQITDFEIELIISNDNSLDKTEEVAQNYIQKHVNGHRIKYKRQEKNLGSTLNYLWVLEHCQGDYIAVCDGDDFWTDPLKLQKQIDFLENHLEFIGSFHNRYKCDQKGDILSNSIQEKEKRNWDFDGLVATMPEIPSASVVFRKPPNFSLPKEFKSVVVNGDTFLWVYLLQFGDFYYEPTSSPCYYRQHSNGLWSSKSSFIKTKLSHKTYLLLQQSFPEKESVKNQLFEIRNNLFYYAFKEKEIVFFIKYYVLNLFFCIIKPRYFSSFLRIHRPLLNKFSRK